MIRLSLCLLLVLGTSSRAIGQVIAEPLRGAEILSAAARQDDKREGSARFFDPKDGQLDLSYFLEDPRGFLPIPIVVTEPAVGYGGGFAGMTTSAPSNPPSSAYSAMVIAASRSGSRSKRSRNRLSHVGLLKPARSPCTWCERPPVAAIATRRSSG